MHYRTSNTQSPPPYLSLISWCASTRKLMWLWTNVYTFQHKNDYKVQAYAWKKEEITKQEYFSAKQDMIFFQTSPCEVFQGPESILPLEFCSVLNSPLCPLSLSLESFGGHILHIIARPYNRLLAIVRFLVTLFFCLSGRHFNLTDLNAGTLQGR